MINIKIVTLKDTKQYIDEYLGYVSEEDKAYSIKEYELFIKRNKTERTFFKKNFGKEKLEFLEIVRRNTELENVIKSFRDKFEIKENLPYANYYYAYEYKNITVTPNIQITKKQQEFIEKTQKKYHMHELLEPLFVNLLYTGKILLSDINLNEKIKIEDNCPNEVNIVLSSKEITQHLLTSYIEKNWYKKISPLVKKIKTTKEKIVLNDKHKEIYDLHNYDGLSYGDLSNKYDKYSKGTIKTICADTKKNKIIPIFETKENYQQRQEKTLNQKQSKEKISKK